VSLGEKSAAYPVIVMLCKVVKFFNYQDSHRKELVEAMEKVFVSQGVGKQVVEPFISSEDT
jgi:hypothetical protein